MGTRKGYPFSRRAYKQGWGIFITSLIVLFGIGLFAVKCIKALFHSGSAITCVINSKNDDITEGDKLSNIFMVVFYVLIFMAATLMLVLLFPLMSDIFSCLFFGS